MTRSESRAISSIKTVSASSDMTASAERTDTRTDGARTDDACAGDTPDHRSSLVRYRRDDRLLSDPPTTTDPAAGATARRVDLDPRSAIPLAIAFAILAISVWFIRSIPRTLAAHRDRRAARVRAQSRWSRRCGAAPAGTAATRPRVVLVSRRRDPRSLRSRSSPCRRSTRSATSTSRSRKTVKQLGRLPIIGPRLREANASKKVQQWLDDAPEAPRA